MMPMRVLLPFAVLAVCLAAPLQAAGLYLLNTDGDTAHLGRIDRLNVDGDPGSRTTVADVDPSPFSSMGAWRGFATDGRYFYYVNTSSGSMEGQIERTNLDGSNRTVVVPAAASQFSNHSDWQGFATDGRHFYYLNTENSGAGGGQIDRTNMDGSNRVTVADIAPSIYNSIASWKGFATDGRSFYVLNTEGTPDYAGRIDRLDMNGANRVTGVYDVDPDPFGSIDSWRGFAMGPAYKPQAHYRLDEAPGASVVVDSAGGNDASLLHPARVGQGVVSSGTFGSAYDFQPGGGQGGGIDLGTSHTVLPTDDFTISFRFQADTLNQFDRFVEAMNGTAATSLGLRIDMGSSGKKIRALLRDGSGSSETLECSETLQAGRWYFASVRYDKDGQLQVTVAPDNASPGGTVIADHTLSQAAALTNGVVYAANQRVLLGVESSSAAANAFDGRLDDVAFYGSVLSDDQLKFVRRFGAQTSLPDEAWDAADAGATSTKWASNLGGGEDWNLSGGAVLVANDSSTRLDSALRLAGTGKAQAAGLLPGRNENLTVELWVRPTDLLGQEILMEAGGDGNGFSLLLDDNRLRFRLDQDAASGWSSADNLEVSTLLAPYLMQDFFQVVGVIDLPGDAVELYVNGELVAMGLAPADLTAWAGGNSDCLGSSNGTGSNIGGSDSGDLNAYGVFEGDIGAVRMYHRILSAAEIRDSFMANMPVPEPLTLAALALASAALGGYARRRRR